MLFKINHKKKGKEYPFQILHKLERNTTQLILCSQNYMYTRKEHCKERKLQFNFLEENRHQNSQ
jgi:hypothetical protein